MALGAKACRYYRPLNCTDLASLDGLKFLVKLGGRYTPFRERNSIITFLSYFEVPRKFLLLAVYHFPNDIIVQYYNSPLSQS